MMLTLRQVSGSSASHHGGRDDASQGWPPAFPAFSPSLHALLSWVLLSGEGRLRPGTGAARSPFQKERTAAHQGSESAASLLLLALPAFEMKPHCSGAPPPSSARGWAARPFGVCIVA